MRISPRLPVKPYLFCLFFCFYCLLPAWAHAEAFHIVAFGDSLMAGYRLAPEDAFPNQLERALRKQGYHVRVTNAGVSGETTGMGLQRVNQIIGMQPNMVILELGANDALRGQSPEQAQHNLEQMITRFQQAQIPVMLAGMKAPRNLGPSYTEVFDRIYPQLAEHYPHVTLYPFFLEGVALQPTLNQDDGLHPTAEGIAVIVQNITPCLQPLLPARE